jgi:hypothetical protein
MIGTKTLEPRDARTTVERGVGGNCIPARGHVDDCRLTAGGTRAHTHIRRSRGDSTRFIEGGLGPGRKDTVLWTGTERGTASAIQTGDS